jgi:hypothetical protein
MNVDPTFRKKHSLLVGGQYVDEYYMARLLEELTVEKQEMNDMPGNYTDLVNCELYHITLRCLINAHTL